MASLSLRVLAEHLDVSPGSLLYHFASKEGLTIEILRRAGDRQRELFRDLDLAPDAEAGHVCAAVWDIVRKPGSRNLFALFFEVYGLALVDPKRFPDFFPAAVENWLTFLERPYARGRSERRDARARATIVLATFRGFLLDLCATGDYARVDRAVALWIASL